MAGSLLYEGTDLIGEDDLSQSPWAQVNGGAVEIDAAAGPTGAMDAARVYAASTGSFRAVVADEIAMPGGVHTADFWVKAGTVSTVTLAIIVSTYEVASASVLYGPGAVVVSGSRANVSGLSTTEWSIIRIVSKSIAAGNHDVAIYPNQAGAVTAGDDIYVWRPRCIAGDGTGAGWYGPPVSGCYELYRRAKPGASDTLIATLPDDTLSHTVTGLLANSIGFYWLRAVTVCGVADVMPVANRLRLAALDGSADLIDPAPNAPYNLRLTAGADGRVTARWAYRGNNAEAVAAKFFVYIAEDPAAISYTTPDFTVNTVQLDNSQALGTFDHGTIVKCVVRAATAGDVAETNTNEAQATADDTAPAVPAALAVEAEAS